MRYGIRRVGLVQCLDIGNMSLGRYALFSADNMIAVPGAYRRRRIGNDGLAGGPKYRFVPARAYAPAQRCVCIG